MMIISSLPGVRGPVRAETRLRWTNRRGVAKTCRKNPPFGSQIQVNIASSYTRVLKSNYCVSVFLATLTALYLPLWVTHWLTATLEFVQTRVMSRWKEKKINFTLLQCFKLFQWPWIIGISPLIRIFQFYPGGDWGGLRPTCEDDADGIRGPEIVKEESGGDLEGGEDVVEGEGVGGGEAGGRGERTRADQRWVWKQGGGEQDALRECFLQVRKRKRSMFLVIPIFYV